MTNNLADRYAEVKLQIEALENILEELKKDIKKQGCEEIVGQTAKITYSLYEIKSFDSKKAKAFLTDQQIKACTTIKLNERINYKIITEALV